MSNLEKAAQAVLDRWDSPQWDWKRQGPTSELMADMRRALAAHKEQAEPVAISDFGVMVIGWHALLNCDCENDQRDDAIEALVMALHRENNRQYGQQAEPVVVPEPMVDQCTITTALLACKKPVKQAEPVVDDGPEYGIDEDTGRVK